MRKSPLQLIFWKSCVTNLSKCIYHYKSKAMKSRLPIGFRKNAYVFTLSESSRDTANGPSMVTSDFKVINVKALLKYLSLKKSCYLPKDCDALYIAPNNDFTLIEFKNSTNARDVKPIDILQKIYDSLIALIELNVIPSLDFSRRHGSFLLVHHLPARRHNVAYINNMANHAQPNDEFAQYKTLRTVADKGFLFSSGKIQYKDDFEKKVLPYIEKDVSILNIIKSLL